MGRAYLSVVVILGIGCISSTQAADTPNVLVILSEDHGVELGCYQSTAIDAPKTPRIDRLAEQGVRYTRAYTTNPVCSPSRASVLTGLYPHQHGQLGLATHKYSMYSAWPNMFSLLKAHGYRTGIIGKIHVAPESAFPFDFRALSGSNFQNRSPTQFATAAADFFRQRDRPFFLMVNLPDAHVPYVQPGQKTSIESNHDDRVTKTLTWVGVDSPRLRQYTADYYDCLERLDDAVGKVLDALEATGEFDRTMIVFLSDHGPQFSRGKMTLYEGGVHIPLVIRFPPAFPAGIVDDRLVSVIDLLPTVLDVTNCPAGRSLPGHSLLSSNPRQSLFFGQVGATAHWTFPQRAVRNQRFKLVMNLAPERYNPVAWGYAAHVRPSLSAGCTYQEIADSPPDVQRAYATWEQPPALELYDLLEDPNELNNIAYDPKYQAALDEMLRTLQKWQIDTQDPFRVPRLLREYLDEAETVARQYGGVEGKYRFDDRFSWQYAKYCSTTRNADSAMLPVASLPPLPTPFLFSCIGTHQGKLILAGGVESDGREQSTRRLSRHILTLDEGTNRWIAGGSLPQPRAHAAVVSTSSGIYIIGGCVQARSTHGESLEWKPSQSIIRLEWNPETQRVDVHDNALPVLPVPVQGHAAVCIGDRLYVLASYLSSENQQDSRLDSKAVWSIRLSIRRTGRWRHEKTWDGWPRQNMAVATNGRELFMAGGSRSGLMLLPAESDSLLSDVHAYDPGRGDWRRLADLPAAAVAATTAESPPNSRIAGGVLVARDTFLAFIAGPGIHSDLSHASNHRSIALRYDDQLYEWHEIGMVPFDTSGAASTEWTKSRIVIAGGNHGIPSAAVWTIGPTPVLGSDRVGMRFPEWLAIAGLAATLLFLGARFGRPNRLV